MQVFPEFGQLIPKEKGRLKSFKLSLSEICMTNSLYFS